MVTADALHTQREHAEFLVSDKKAHYILIVKKNQPGLHAQLRNLPWRNIPAAHRQRNRGHGREEQRTLKAATVTAGLAFPHAAQAIRITRRTRPLSGGKWRTVTVYAITSLTVIQATPAQLAGWIRGHWQIEALHHIRDVTYGEDASQIRTGNGPAGHGHPAQPRHRHPETSRAPHHRRRLPPPQPRRHPHPDHPRTQHPMTETDITPLCRGPGNSARLLPAVALIFS